MAYFSRLMAFVFALFAFGSFAAIPAVQSVSVWFGGNPYPVSSFDVNGCKQGISAFYGSTSPWISTVTFSANSSTNGLCSGGFGEAAISVTSSSCPQNSISVAGNCVCQAGFEEENGACVPENGCPAAGTQEGAAGELYETIGNYPPSSICSGGCSWSTSGGEGCMNGKCFYKGPLTSLNTTCVPSSPGPGDGTTPPTGEPEQTPPEDKQCVEKGLCPFYYNGTKFCTKCDSKEGTSSESGSSSTDSTDAAGNPTGSTGSTNTTKETTANCSGDRCTTSTTTTTQNPDGTSTVKTETGELDKGDFCKSNPGHVVCKGEDEGTWGGSCAGGFQCSGDAVQCAQAEAGWKSACASDVSGMTEQINDGTAAMAAGAASGLGIPGGSDAFDLGSRLSEVPLFGSSGGCPSDVSVNVGGTSYTIAFSSMCPQLQVLGVALMAFAYLVAGFIVFRGDRS